MKCPNCRAEMQKRKETIKYDECGLEGITLDDVTVHVCSNCGERATAISRIELLHKTIALSIAERPERLGPAEIRFLRKYLGLSSADFARKIGTDASTVSRWESKDKPQSMGEQSEKLLRIMVLTEKPVESYPLEEMATKDAKPMRMRLVADAKGWAEA